MMYDFNCAYNYHWTVKILIILIAVIVFPIRYGAITFYQIVSGQLQPLLKIYKRTVGGFCRSGSFYRLICLPFFLISWVVTITALIIAFVLLVVFGFIFSVLKSLAYTLLTITMFRVLSCIRLWRFF